VRWRLLSAHGGTSTAITIATFIQQSIRQRLRNSLRA